MIKDFAKYYDIAKQQNNIKAMAMLKAIIIELLDSGS